MFGNLHFGKMTGISSRWTSLISLTGPCSWEGGLNQESDLLLGQVIAVANSSFRGPIGILSQELMEEVARRIRIILNL